MGQVNAVAGVRAPIQPTTARPSEDAAASSSAESTATSFWGANGKTIAMGAIGAAALVGTGLLALNPGTRRFALPALGAGLLGVLLAGCTTSGTGSSKGTIDIADTGDWKLAPPRRDNADLRKLVTDVITPSTGVAGVSGERMGTQNALQRVPVAQFVEQWNADGVNRGDARDTALQTALERSRASTNSSVYSTSDWSQLTSASGTSTTTVYAFEETAQGQALGRPIGNRTYDTIEDAVGTIDAVADAVGQVTGGYAIVRTADGLRPFKVDKEFAGITKFDDLLVERPDIEAIVTDGNVYVPSADVSEVAGSGTAKVFSYRASVDGVGSLAPGVDVPLETVDRSVPAPNIDSARVGALTVQSRMNWDGYTTSWDDDPVMIDLQLDDRGGIAQGYASLADAFEGVRIAHEANEEILPPENYFVAKIGGGWYVAPGEYSSHFQDDGGSYDARATKITSNADIEQLHVVHAPDRWSGATQGFTTLDLSSLVRGDAEVR